jgi:NAD-dependent dihydropyrimidine dehydrogenase PreA subunit
VSQNLRIFTIATIDEASGDVEPTKISKSVLIKSDLTWILHINGIVANGSRALSSIPTTLSLESFQDIMNIIHTSKVCTGYNAEGFVDMCFKKKGVLCNKKGKIVAFLHKGYPIQFGESYTIETVRHNSCELLVQDECDRCASCNDYLPTLKAMYSYYKKKDCTTLSTPKSTTNMRFIRTPIRQKVNMLQRNALNVARRTIRNLNAKLELATTQEGIQLNDDDVTGVIDIHQSEVDAMKEDDFRKIFWTQQVIEHYVVQI